jgi:hypothetical protein
MMLPSVSQDSPGAGGRKYLDDRTNPWRQRGSRVVGCRHFRANRLVSVACRRCGHIVRKFVMGLCIACSVLVAHGADDEGSAGYSVQNLDRPALATGSSSSGNITITPDPVRLTLTVLAPTVSVSVASSST